MPAGRPTGIIRHNVLIPSAVPRTSIEPFSHPTNTRSSRAPRQSAAPESGEGSRRGTSTSQARMSSLSRARRSLRNGKHQNGLKGFQPSILKISLKKDGGGTRVSMIQSRVPASQVDQYDKGWYESYWEPLKRYFRAKAPSK
jgi:hypothetical protein